MKLIPASVCLTCLSMKGLLDDFLCILLIHLSDFILLKIMLLYINDHFQRYLNHNAYFFFLIIYAVFIPLKSNEIFMKLNIFIKILNYLCKNLRRLNLEDSVEDMDMRLSLILEEMVCSYPQKWRKQDSLISTDMDALPIKEGLGF